MAGAYTDGYRDGYQKGFAAKQGDGVRQLLDDLETILYEYPVPADSVAVLRVRIEEWRARYPDPLAAKAEDDN